MENLKDKKICIVENCNNKIKAKGYCDKHRKQLKRHKRLTPEREHRTTCSLEECNNKHFCKGYCRNHYYRYVIKKK